MNHRLLLTAALLITFPSASPAEPILYATDGQALYTVDAQTGALTFQSNGPLQWIASPAFDEEHHTRFWITGNQPGGYGWLPEGGVTYAWGNPFTGATGGPFITTVTWNPIPRTSFTNTVVYAPNTRRLYTLGISIEPWGTSQTAMAEIDQFAGAPRPGIGNRTGFWDGNGPGFAIGPSSIAAAYEPATEHIVVCLTPGDFAYTGVDFWSFDPVTGGQQEDSGSRWGFNFFFNTTVSVQAMAIDPVSGALFGVFSFPEYGVMELVRITPITPGAAPTYTTVSSIPWANWSMNFADDQYVK